MENKKRRGKRTHGASKDTVPTYTELGEPITKARKRRGQAPETIRLLEQIAAIVTATAPTTVRSVAYQLFVRALIPSMAVGQTQKVSRLLGQAREQGIVPWAAIVDESRQMERPLTFDNVGQFADAMQRWFRRDFWTTQPTCLQVWSEKTTAAGILRPLLDQYGIPFMIVHGFASKTSLHDAAVMSADDKRDVVILYCGDHDPSGMFMSEEDIPGRILKYKGVVTVRRIALTPEDLPSLPSFPAKTDDKRYPWYKRHYGAEAWEMDALDTNTLRARIEAAILEYVEPDAWHRMELVEAAEQKTIFTVAAALKGAN